MSNPVAHTSTRRTNSIVSTETRRQGAHAPSQGVFERFYRDHLDGTWRTLRRLGVMLGDCEDAAQEVFITAHRHWHRFDDAVPRRVWLLGIVRRIAWRYRRTDERRARRVAAVAVLAPIQLSPEDVVARQQAARLLVDFLDGLDDDKREAFVLGELEELGRGELGRALGINPNTAYSRLHAARRRFVAHFAALDDDGCALLLVHAELEAPDDVTRARAWAGIAPALARQPGALGGLSARLTAASGVLPAAAALIGLVIGFGVPAALVGGARDAPPGPHEVSVDASAPMPATHTATTVAEPPDAQVPRPTRAHHPQRPNVRRAGPEHGVAEADAAGAVAASGDHAELESLLSARRALLEGDDARASALLEAHRRRWGAGAPLEQLYAAMARDLAANAIKTGRAGDRSVR